MKTNDRRMYIMWSEAQIHYLVELVVEHGMGLVSHWDEVTAKHNQRFGLGRSDKALRMAYTRLKDCFTFVSYKKTWKLMKDNAELFSQPRRAQSGTSELKETKAELGQLKRQMAQMMTLLDAKTAPN